MNAHARMMMEYRAARAADEQTRDDAVDLYGRDSPEWREYPHYAMITFHKWLIQSKGR